MEPILNAFDDNSVDVCYEVHPVEDIHDGDTFERFLEATGNHKRVNILYDPSHFVLQQLDYIAYIDHYHEFIKAFHVKDSDLIQRVKKEHLEVIMIGKIELVAITHQVMDK
jgi:sugar phosphate isomerase/epimerase